MVGTDPNSGMESLAQMLLAELPGWKDLPDEHKRDTPKRFVKMLLQMTDASSEEFDFTVFPNEGIDEMVVLSPIPFYTLCAHHVVPFYGVASIAYIPDDHIAGLSKFARTVKLLSKGLHVQEELTTEIAEYLEKHLDPKGVAVVMRGEHMCMSMRGVQQPGVVTTTSKMTGVFLDPTKGAREEFLSLIRSK
jgi:GTP cyclohydrolase I